MAKQKKKASVMIKVDDGHLDRVKEVVTGLRAAGLDVEQVMDEVGTVTGSVDAAKLGALSGVAGVAAIERTGGYQLPPPDSEVQ